MQNMEEQLCRGAGKNKNRKMTEYEREKVRALVLGMNEEELEVAKKAMWDRRWNHYGKKNID